MRLKFCVAAISLALSVLLVLLTVACTAPEERKSELDPNTVPGKWAAKLKDKDYAVRERAVLNLGRLREAKAESELLSALEDEDWHVRLAAAWALGEIGADSGEVIAALAKVYLRDSSTAAMETAAETLKQLGGKADETFIKGLESPFWYVRSLALGTLGREGNFEAIAPIIPLLNDGEFDVRLAAAFALSVIGGDGLEVLNYALEGKELPEELVKKLEIKDVKKLKFFTEKKEKKEGVVQAINMALGKDDDIYAIDKIESK
jgi:HEAT repeat protein